ncbi:DUF2213 domain-containing protein [Pelagibacterium sp. 26DY04]|uniref:DUF2213 domain-containing protein n=1 Tax=Pelagibacterium sp. 26DY04 TaxID=2967130 RepID=UPI00281638D4|nr:DUF2213 domain-containing protein [Pelagibacterium sp. 26DY04]WMT85577.1 DUF2213 domain-containing protein [Pelagibacterium sp. 26DY04]
MQFTDAVTVAGKPRRTADGYLIAEAKCVRTGIQLYTGDEVGRPDLNVVRVYRGPDEVFAQDSLQSFSHAPVTVDHPSEQVTADNWRQLSVGEVSTAAKQDGEWVMLPLILKDAAAINAVEAGKRELSAGYLCELDWTPGVTADGQPFDAQQRSIKINHLALVDRARAGSQARIGDEAGKWGAAPIHDATPEKETPMNLKTVTVDGIPVEVTDQGATVIATLQQRLADAAKKATEADTAHAAALAAKDKEIATKDAEIDDLKAKVVDGAALDKLVADRAALVTVATKIAKDVKTDGLSDADIRKAVVTAKLGDAAVKDKSADYISARFDILAEDAGKETTDTFRETLRSGIQSNDSAMADEDKAYAASIADLNRKTEAA